MRGEAHQGPLSSNHRAACTHLRGAADAQGQSRAVRSRFLEVVPAIEQNEPGHGSVTFGKPVRQGLEGRLLPSSAPEGSEAEAGVLLLGQHPCQRLAGRRRRTIVGARRGTAHV
jgi:hypothetical protein